MTAINPVWSQGTFSRQAHRDIPEGTYEREVGQRGFDGPATHFYHLRPPTDWVGFEGPLSPRAFDLTGAPLEVNPFDAPTVLSNDHCLLRFWRTTTSTPELYRNIDGDMLIFIHRGECELFCDYGHIRLVEGDYLVVPRGTMWRIETAALLEALLLETTDQHIELPERGLLGKHAMFDPAQLDIPKFDELFGSQDLDKSWSVVVQRGRTQSKIHYAHNPLDAVGWIGDLAPVRINVNDLLPITSHRYHLPPSVHATFQTEYCMISTFVPRPFETDETALKVPFFHSNDDVDEVIFYHKGNFFSRDDIEPGALTFHPAGFTHGPQPGAQRNMFKAPSSHTNEVAVMIDSMRPLNVGAPVSHAHAYASNDGNGANTSHERCLQKMELTNYPDSWSSST